MIRTTMTRHINKSRLQYIVVFVSTMTFSSCINDLPYDDEIGAPKLVLNALLQPDSLLTATVSRTAHFLDTGEPQRIADATVTAIINGTEAPLTYSSDTKRYHSTYRLCPNDTVTLTVTHIIGTVTATAQVMTPTAITIAHTDMQPFTNPGDPVSLATLNEVDSALLVSLHIDDPVNESNYYRLMIDYKGNYLVSIPDNILYSKTQQKVPKDNEENVESDTRKECFYPHYLLTESSSRLVTESKSAALFLGELLYLTGGNSFIFSDQHLRNAEGQPVIDFLMLMEYPRGSDSNMYNPESGWGEDEEWADKGERTDGEEWTNGNGWSDDFIFPADTVSHATYHYHFTLETLSEDYYRYLNDITSYRMTGGMGIGEPTPIHTNIYGGLGIVGSYGNANCSTCTHYRFKRQERVESTQSVN